LTENGNENSAREKMKVKHVLIVGSGIMGSGIAQVCAQAGYRSIIMDIDDVLLDQAMKSIEWSLKKMEEKGNLEEPHEDIVKRITKTTVMDLGKDADIVIEAVYENLETKQEVLKSLEQICPKKAVFGTNTSSLPITEIGAKMETQERFVGIHFFNPVHRMKLVEIVKGLMTSESTVNTAKDFVVSLGKEPVVVNCDIAGFIVNRINGMAFLEAIRLLERGVANVKDIDKAMRLGLGHPMGPFELMDLVGLDVVLNARMGVYDETRDPAHFPPATLKRMVQSGRLGRKTKKGFYDYSS